MTYEVLKQKIDEYNWDDGFELPIAILDDPNCDLSLALEVFYLGDGYSCFELLTQDLDTYEKSEWELFIHNLYNDIKDGKYENRGNSFVNPLNKVQRYKLTKQSIPEIFLMDIPGA